MGSSLDGNPNPRIHRSSGKPGFTEFPHCNGGPEGWDFQVQLNTNDQFLFSHTQFNYIWCRTVFYIWRDTVQYITPEVILDVNKQF